MRSVTLIALLPFFTRATSNGFKQATNHSEDPLETTGDQKLNDLVDHFASKFSDEVLTMWSFQHANLERTILGKVGNLPSPLAFRPPCPLVRSQPARFFASNPPSLLDHRPHRAWTSLHHRLPCAYAGELDALRINDMGNRYPVPAHQLEDKDGVARMKANAVLRIVNMVTWRSNKVLNKCKYAVKSAFAELGPVAKRALETPVGKAVMLILFCVLNVR